MSRNEPGKGLHPQIVHLDLLSIVEFPPHGMSSQVLIRSPHCTYTLLGLAKGHYIELHDSSGNIVIQVLRGTGMLDLVDSEVELSEGVFLFIPAHVTQGLLATSDTALLHCVIHEAPPSSLATASQAEGPD